MRRVPNIKSALLACAAILSASAWSGAADACRIPAVMATEMPNATEIVPHQQRRAPATREAHPAPSHAATPKTAVGPRLDCRACIGMMPPLNSQDLMPLVPFAEPILRIHPIDPPADQVDRSGENPGL